MKKSYLSSDAALTARSWAVMAAVFAVVLMGTGATGVLAEPAGRPGSARAASDPIEAVIQPVTDWLERANREYQDNVLKELSVPTGKRAPLEAVQVTPRAANAPGILDQVKGLLGMEGPPADAAGAAARERDEALTRQIEARKLEQERNAAAQRLAEQQRLAAEARRSAEVDAVTRQSQKTAELARVAEEERRKAGKAAADVVGGRASDDAAERKIAVAAEKVAAEKAAAERKVAAAAEKVAAEKAAAERKVALAAAEKVAAEKAAAERKVALAAAEKDTSKKPKAVPGGEKIDRVRTAGAEPGEGVVVAGSKRLAKAGSRPGGGRCSRAGRDVALPAVYVVKSGDTLWDISRRHYDKGYKFEKIVRANASKIGSPDLIYPCQKFYLPGRHAFFLVLPMEERDAS